MSVTATVLEAKIRREVKDESSDQYSQAEIWDYMNQGVRLVMRRIAATWPYYWLRTAETQLAQSNLVATTANYDLPSDLYLIIAVTTEDSDGDSTEREPLTFARTLDDNADGYFLRNDDIYLCATPDASVTNGLSIYYVSRPTAIAAGGTTVPLSDDFEDAILEWVVLKCKARQEEKTADPAAIYKLIQEQLDALVGRTNMHAQGGLSRVAWKNWI